MSDARWTERITVARCLALLSVFNAVIHFSVAGTHFQEYWLFGAFMLAAAWCQLGFALVAFVRPSRVAWCFGALLDAAIIAVYIVTRTAGDVIGPTPRAVESAGFGDVTCTVVEAVVVVGCIWLLASTRDRLIAAVRGISATGAIGALAAAALSFALVAGGPEMVMSMGSDVAGAATPPIELATASPAGPITAPDPMMQMAPGMRMASSAACTAQPTSQQKAAAVSLVDQSWTADQKYRSLSAAEAAGFVPLTPPGLPVVHYINRTYYMETAAGRPVLNTAAPQVLVYANTPAGARLAAVMYLSFPGGSSPDPGGCLTQWHVHTNLCIDSGALKVVAIVDSAHPTCPLGSRNFVTPPMLHVWFVPIPGGPLAVDAPDATVVHAAEQVPSPSNGMA